ncbi:a-pheromone processing metallopeptidase ste23 [Moniliophthora roreri]|nr:a-pheromone processing metallopeptidase ste23 [Moniliophthora roreri]
MTSYCINLFLVYVQVLGNELVWPWKEEFWNSTGGIGTLFTIIIRITGNARPYIWFHTKALLATSQWYCRIA